MLGLNPKSEHSDIEFLDKFSYEFESLRVVINLFRNCTRKIERIAYIEIKFSNRNPTEQSLSQIQSPPHSSVTPFDSEECSVAK